MTKKILFSGTATALVTPFRNGEIDYETLDALIERQIQGGVEALVIGGTTAEAATLSDRERYRLFRFAAERAAGRVKLIFGTGTNDTKQAVKHTRYAAAIGCDGVLVVTPYYNRGTSAGILSHYLAIADASPLPLLLYNVPSRTGVNLGMRQLEELAKCPGIVGIKEAGDSAQRLAEIAALGDALPLYAGNDSCTYTVLSLGGRGVISVLSNLLPRTAGEIPRRFFAGRQEESLSLQLSLLPRINALFYETNPAPVKYLMAKAGLTGPDLRLPLAPVSSETAARIDTVWGDVSRGLQDGGECPGDRIP